MLFPVPARPVGWVMAMEVSQQCQHPWPAASTTQGNGCGTCTLRGNLPQPLWGHILPACASHPSVCGCLECLSSVFSYHSSSTSPNVNLHVHEVDIPSVMVTAVTGLHCRLHRHTLTQVKAEETLHLIPICISPESEQEGFLPHEWGKGCCVSQDEAACLRNPL